MDRGLQLACEQCDFTATLYERLPFALDAEGQPHALAPAAAQPAAGYWSDGLCGECRLPVRTAHWIDAAPEGTVDVTVCPRCGAEPLTFDAALHELAEACHSRAWLDLAAENEARRRVQQAIDASAELEASVRVGDRTTSEALDEMTRTLAVATGEALPASASLEATSTLEDLVSLIENAHSAASAAKMLDERLRLTAPYIEGLETCVHDETQLPGVPCPRCGSGHLVHWPFWL